MIAVTSMLSALQLPKPNASWLALSADECTGWRDGSLGVWCDHMKAHMPCGKRTGFTSQYGQDKSLWEHHFKSLSRPGVYVDVAANHYKRASNTYFFDRCAGWSGFCVEPNPIYHGDLASQRSCTLVPTCASNVSREATLALPNGLDWKARSVDSGLYGGLLGSDSSKGNILKHPPAAWKQVSLTCTPLQHVFDRHGVRAVDFMSLDVEGHEEEVINGIDFERTWIDWIVCESHCQSLHARGYKQVHWPNHGPDTLWKRKSLAE